VYLTPNKSPQRTAGRFENSFMKLETKTPKRELALTSGG
jgi:hypothetical protein